MSPLRVATSLAVITLAACTPVSTTGDGSPDVARDAVSLDALADSGDTPDAPTSPDPLAPSLAPPIDMDPAHYPAGVWTTSSLSKLATDAPPGTTHWALLFAARNEFESFQVHAHATGAPVQLDVTVSDLTLAHGTGTLSSADHITVSREAYLDITQRSDANGRLGHLPDPLIPARDRYAHEARNAFPTTVPAGETRSAWIDVHVPPETPSGWYTGMVTVRDGATVLAQLPVRLGVWDFELNATASLASTFEMSWNGLCAEAYGDYFHCGQFPGAGGDNDRGTELTHVQQAAFFLDHRVTIGNVVYSGPSGSDWTAFDALYRPLLQGTAPTVLAGAQLTSIQYMADLTNAATIQRWTSHFSDTGWLRRLFFYHCDEPPHGCPFSTAQAESAAVHGATPPGSYLLTTDLAGATSSGLLDGIDRLVPVVDSMEPRGGTNQRGSYDAWLAHPARMLWWYQSCDQHESCSNGTAGGPESTWPSYMIDASPVRNRVFQWLAFVYDVSGELYYDTDYCWQGACGGDVWAGVYAFGGNGDGTLFYPGTPARIGGTTPIPVSSIRLELIRDGMEDYEYLHLLSVTGDDAFARSTSRTIITNAHAFDNDPDHYLAARQALGERLHRRRHP